MILSSQPLNVNLTAAHKARTCALAFTLHILESSNLAREEASETHDLCKHCSFDPQNFTRVRLDFVTIQNRILKLNFLIFNLN